MRRLLSLALVAALGATANAATIDGSTAGDGYGAALAVQTNETSFGDNQSELNAGYGYIEAGKLNIVLTGQIENNFNKLEIWIDANAGGSSTFTSAGNDGAGNMDGLQFDAAFTPETHIIARNGNDGADKFDLDFANLLTSAVSSQFSLFGASLTGSGSVPAGGPANASAIDVGYDNSNILGVGGGGATAADQVAAAAVTTGLELSIDLADLGYVGGDIRVSALVNNGGHDFAANQVLGGLPIPSGHLANLSSVNFDALAGDQFFTISVVPEPTTALLAGLALVGFAARRRV